MLLRCRFGLVMKGVYLQTLTQAFPVVNVYVSLSRVAEGPVLSWGSRYIFPDALPSTTTDSAAACFSLSLSSGRVSFFFDSSSSLSPRLNGSWSATGSGLAVDRGCHLLALPPLETTLFVESGDARYPTSISSGGPSWKETRRSPRD